MKRGQLTDERAKARIAAQMPLELKCEKAHFVIDNSRDIANLKKEVNQLIVTLRSSNAHWKMRIYFIVSMACIFYAIMFLSNLYFG
jgi:dephospho-CoA kinase